MHANYISWSEHHGPLISQLNLKKIGKEWHGSCPFCGGEDRFWIADHNGELKHHCRQDCDFQERSQLLRERGLLPEYQLPKLSTEPYHRQKRLPLLGARLDEQNVIIPILNLLTGERCGEQTISPNGFKKFTKGLVKAGAGALLGDYSGTIYIAEGWATACAVSVSTGHQACFGLDANNLQTVAEALSKLYPDANLIVAADADDAGVAAAQKTGLPYARPTVDGHDFWDVWSDSGAVTVIAQLSCLKSVKIDILEGFSFVTSSELIAKSFDPLRFLIPDILPIPNLVLLAGAPKAGKSWYALGLAQQLSEAGHHVVYLGNEDNEPRLKARFAAISSFPNDRVIFFAGLSNDKPLPKGRDALAFLRGIKAKFPNVQCVIIDTIQGIRISTDKQDYGAIEHEFSQLRKLAHELNITIIAVHHTKKKTDFESTPIDMILGSQGIAATVETILILQQEVGSKNAKLFITGKDIEQVEDKKLTWSYPGFSRPENAIIADLGSFQHDVFQYIQEQPRCTQVAISTYLAKSPSQVSEAVSRLIERGLIKRSDDKRLVAVQVL